MARYITAKPCPTCNKRSSCEAKFVGSTTWITPKDAGLPQAIGHYLSDHLYPGLDTKGAQVYFEYESSLIMQCGGCGRWRIAREVRGRYNPKLKCGARCQNATGFDCECSCGGKNHGAGYDR